MISEIPFDAIITLFVFLVGIPALVLQALPMETRLLVTKRWWNLIATIAWPILVALAVVIIGIVLTRQVGFNVWIWGVILATLFAIVCFTAFRIPRLYGRRDVLVASLADEVGRGLDANCRIHEDSLSELIELGKYGKAGREKGWVLNALLDLTHRVTGHERYEGEALEDVIFGTIDIVGSAPGERSGRNLSSAANILRCVIMRYEAADDKPPSQADLIHAIRASSTLGRLALHLDNSSIALGIVQACGSARAGGGESMTSQTLFEIGVAAIEQDRMLIAMAALSRLVTLIDARKPAGGELAADTLGLVAHFWGAGRSGRDYAHERLAQIRNNLDQDVDTALESAARHCAKITHFRTADLLQEMRDTLTEKAPVTRTKEPRSAALE